MDPTPFLIVTRMLVAAVCTASVAALVLAALERSRPRRELAPILALAALLVVAVTTTFWLLEPLAQSMFLLLAVLFATYPDGHFVPRWTIVVVIAWVPLTAVLLVSEGISEQRWWWLVPTAGGLLLLGAQLYRYLRRSTSREREATRWAILGVGTSMLVFLVLSTMGEIGTPGTTAEAWANLAILPYILGPVVGLVRPQLWNVDAVFRGFLTLVAAALPLAVAYAAVSITAGALGASTASAGWWGAAAVAASAFPVIRLASRLSTAIVFRGRGDPDAAVALLGERLDDLPDPLDVAQAVADAVRTDRVVLEGEVFSARVGPVDEGPSAAESFPILFHGDVLATLTVWPRPGEESLTPYDRALIERLARHSAPALHGARALGELTATHARLLLAREEERRRLRRDLHDDLSPTLSGLRLSAAALARRAESVDPELASTATELARDIQDAVEQTREIAYGLRPPVLDDRGLVAAIRDRIHGQSAADRVHVEIVAPETSLAVPAAIDLAALRIVQEAVANVRRHSGASHCTIVLERAPGELRVRVDDDGRGIPDRMRPGLGLASIRERAGELGGTASIGRSDAGGASILVRLPFDDPTPGDEEAA